MEAEIEIMQLQAKECHPPPEKGKILPQNLWMGGSPATP